MPFIPASSLYIHIPFCRSKCGYCDFYSEQGACGVPDNYVCACLKEIECLRSRRLLGAVSTVYIGGGTPSLLSPVQLSALISAAEAESSAEITVEANPEDIDLSFIESALRAGCTRISLGVQSLSEKSLKASGRRAGLAAIRRACGYLSAARRGGGLSFSADMISGLPYENMEGFKDGLEELVSYGPDHISLYALTIEEGAAFADAVHSGRLAYAQDTNDAQWLWGRDFLISRGYAQYEVSNFAREGCECRHNLAYWRLHSYGGAGAGACGTYIRDNGSALRRICARGAAGYVRAWSAGESGTAALYNEEEIGRDTLMFEQVMMSMRIAEGLCGASFYSRFEESAAHFIGADRCGGVFSRWEARGLAEKTPAQCAERESCGVHYRMTGGGLLFLNRFLEELISL